MSSNIIYKSTIKKQTVGIIAAVIGFISFSLLYYGRNDAYYYRRNYNSRNYNSRVPDTRTKYEKVASFIGSFLLLIAFILLAYYLQFDYIWANINSKQPMFNNIRLT
jgi:hypothetical protein